MAYKHAYDFGNAQDGTFWWRLGDDRIGYYAICPRNPMEPMQLAVHDDMGNLVVVPSVRSHGYFAGRPA